MDIKVSSKSKYNNINSFKIQGFNVLYFAESVLFLILSYYFVPKLDDIVFKFNSFFQYDDFSGFWHSALYYGNGRLLGNALCILFSKNPQLFYFIEFLIVQIFCISGEKLVNIKNSKLFFLTAIILMPIQLINQISSWLCGFINYFIPTVILMLILLLIKNKSAESTLLVKILRCLTIFLLGIAEQLFVQHNAVMNLVIAITVLISFIRKKKNILEPLLLTMSNIIGCIVLFSYKLYVNYEQTWVYQYSIKTGVNYGSPIFHLDNLGQMVKTTVSNAGVFIYFYFGCMLLYTALFISILFALKNGSKIKYKKLNIVMMSLFYAGTIIVFLLYLNDDNENILYSMIVAAIFVLNFASLIYSYVKAIFIHMPNDKKVITFLLVFYGVASFTPFLINTTTGTFRGCFFAYSSFIFFTAITVDFIREKHQIPYRRTMLIFAVIGCIVCSAYIPAYAVQKEIYNYKAENYQTQYYLPKADRALVDSDSMWGYAQGNVKHEFIEPSKLKNQFSSRYD